MSSSSSSSSSTSSRRSTLTTPKGMDRSLSFRRRASVALRIGMSEGGLDPNVKDIADETSQKIIEVIVFLSSRIDESAEVLFNRIQNSDPSDPLSHLMQLPDLESPDRHSLKSLGTDGAVTSLFRFFQNLEEPLFTLNLYNDFILSGGSTPDPVYQECILRSLLNLLPPNTFRVCERLFSFFYQLMFREKMSSAVLGKYFGPIFISTYGGTKFEHIKAAQECVRVITEWYSRLFVNSGTGDLVCQKQGQSTLVLYASVPYTVLLLQDPYYWQQDPSFQRIVFTFHSYFTTSVELLNRVMEGYGFDMRLEREKERERMTSPLTPRDEKKITKRSSEKRLMRSLSRKLSSKLLSLLDPEEEHPASDSSHTASSEEMSAPHAVSTQSLPDLSRSDTGGGRLLLAKQACAKCGHEVTDYMVCDDCQGYYCRDCGKSVKNVCSTGVKHSLREISVAEAKAKALHFTMAASHTKLLQTWSAKRDQQIVSALREWFRNYRDDLIQDDAFVQAFKGLCRAYPELEEPPNCLLQFLFKTTASIHVTSKSDKDKERSSSGTSVFGTLKRKKKTREKMRDIKTKAEKDQEKSKDSLLEEKPVEKLNPLFLVSSQSGTPVGDEKKSSNPLLSVGLKQTNSISPNTDPKVASCYRKTLKLLDQTDRIACHLTILDSRMFKAIHLCEFFKGNISKEERAPNFSKMAKAFNRNATWVASHIVLTHQLEIRVKQVSRFIEIAKACRDLNNFHTLFSIMSGLKNSGVSRLKKTWEMLSQKKLVIFNELDEICQLTNNFRNYVAAESTCEMPILPFLGYIAKTLESLEEGNPLWMTRVEGTSRKERQKMTKSGDSITPSRSQDQLAEDSSEKSEKGKEELKDDSKNEAKQEEDKGLLNFDKLRMLYQFVSEIQRKQSGVYEIDEDVELSGLLEHVPRLSDDELFEQSLICEPRAK